MLEIKFAATSYADTFQGVTCTEVYLLFIYLLISKNPSGYNANVQNYNVAK